MRTGGLAATSMCLVVVVAVWPTTATSAADAILGEEFALARPLAEREPGSFLSRLLTWPKDEDAKAENGKSDEGEKTEGNEDNEKKEEPMETDRPNFTEASTTVGYHRLQLESGYAFTHAVDGDPTADRHDLPELLLRYGVAERLELRLAWDEGAVFDRQTDPVTGRVLTRTGATDLTFGVKYAIRKQDGWRPQAAIIVETTAPAGSPWLSSQQADAYINYCQSWDLNKRLSLSSSTGNQWTGEAGDHYSVFFQSLSPEYALTEKLHVYGEWYVLLRRDALDNRPQHYFDAGLTYHLRPNVQLDWRAGLGLSEAADGFFTGCGLSFRK